jgi:site-specific DNA recombinase
LFCYSKTRNERMSRGREEKARQGRVLRDFQVFGYIYDKETEQFVIDEEEATIVRLIFDLFSQPNALVQGMNGIALYLTDKGVPTKRGARVWHRQVVRQILMNRAYIGEFYQNRWNTEGMLGNKHRNIDEKIPMRERPKSEWILIPSPAIIDVAQFDHTQRILSESRRRWANHSKHLKSRFGHKSQHGSTIQMKSLLHCKRRKQRILLKQEKL